MVTLTVKGTEKEIENYRRLLKEVSETYPDKVNKQSDALNIIFETFKSKMSIGIEKEIPPQIDYVLRYINCPHLKFDPIEGFLCYEHFYKNKKKEFIGDIPNSVLEDCNQCKIGKEDLKQQFLNKMLMRKQVKNILDLRDILINLQKEGGIAQIYICKEQLFSKHNLILSMDGIHLNCPLDGKEIIIEEKCYNAIDPDTLKPPCQYLINPFIKVQIEPTEQAKKIIKEMQALEYQADELEKEKPIEVESEIIEKNNKEKREDKNA